MKLVAIFSVLAMLLTVGESVPLKRRTHNLRSTWKCVFSPNDNGSLWVTEVDVDRYACAGPTFNLCYWFSDENCTNLITDTNLVGKICDCSKRYEGWCAQTNHTQAQTTALSTVLSTTESGTVQTTDVLSTTESGTVQTTNVLSTTESGTVQTTESGTVQTTNDLSTTESGTVQTTDVFSTTESSTVQTTHALSTTESGTETVSQVTVTETITATVTTTVTQNPVRKIFF